MRIPITLATALLFSFATGTSLEAAAKQCRDASGKFTKCETAAKAPVHCRDAKTKKFVKCGTPGSEPVPE